jgi:hypothetical protein
MSERYNLRKRRYSTALEVYENRRTKRRCLSQRKDDTDDEYQPFNTEISDDSDDYSCSNSDTEELKKKDYYFDNQYDSIDNIDEEYSDAEYLESNNEEFDSENDEECYSNDENNYFTLDRSPLVEIIAKRLKTMYPEISAKELHKTVEKSIKNAQEYLIEEYCGCEPKDESWKVGLEDDVVQTLEPRLKSIRLEMKNENPTMEKILKAQIPESDRKNAVKLLDVLKNIEPFTTDYYSIADEIRQIISIENEIEPSDIPRIELEEKRLKSLIGDYNRALKVRILKMDAPDSVKTRVYEMYEDLISMNRSDSEYNSLKQKILWAVSLPHRKIKLPEFAMEGKTPIEINRYCENIYSRLDKRLYGMKKVKERVIQIVNNRIYNPRTKAIVALKGRPGVGKTAVARALAESLDLPFECISLGGMEDPSIFKGTDNSWVGASPSILLQILKRMKVANGIVLFDEIDKLGSNCGEGSRGKIIQYALLHITDYIQNSEFQDIYLNEFPHDISNIWFMFAMNDDNCIDRALHDRLDIIEVDGYTEKEITKIIQLHLLPKALKDVGIDTDLCTITDQACGYLQTSLGNIMRDNGLRPVEKELHQIVSRLNLLRTQLIVDEKDRMKLSYNLPDFEGFPYTITDITVQRLSSIPTLNVSYLSMYT